MYGRILVPVDGSATSNAGLREAARLARDQKASVRIVHVVDEFAVFSTPDGGLNAEVVIESLKQGGRRVLKRAERLAAASGVRAESSLLESLGGRVADVIARQARRWRANLIVMGTHGRRGMNRWLLGSEAELVARNSTVPVLLVHAPGRRKAPPRRRGKTRESKRQRAAGDGR